MSSRSDPTPIALHGRSLLSRSQPAKPAGRAGWLRDRTDRLFLPALAVAETEADICKLRRQGAAARADRLSAWLDAVLSGYGDRVLPLDATAARVAGRLSDAVLARGHDPGFADVAIAAIASVRGHLVLTRNLRHFAVLGIPCTDPLDAPPP